MNLSVKIPYTSVFSDNNNQKCILSIHNGKFVNITLDNHNIEYYLKLLFNYSNISYGSVDLWNKKIKILNEDNNKMYLDDISKSLMSH